MICLLLVTGNSDIITAINPPTESKAMTTAKKTKAKAAPAKKPKAKTAPPKTLNERQIALRDRRAALKLTRSEYWGTEEEHAKAKKVFKENKRLKDMK